MFDTSADDRTLTSISQPGARIAPPWQGWGALTPSRALRNQPCVATIQALRSKLHCQVKRSVDKCNVRHETKSNQSKSVDFCAVCLLADALGRATAKIQKLRFTASCCLKNTLFGVSGQSMVRSSGRAVESGWKKC